MFLSLFIGCKQIIDMIYQVPWFDYGILLWAIVFSAYRFCKNKEYQSFFSKLNSVDYMVIALGILYFISYIRDISYFKTFVQIESCFLLYFMGRMCKTEEIEKHGRILAGFGYFIIYANFLYRFYLFGCRLIINPGQEGLLNTGSLYYYKTDLALGILYAMLFIYLFSKIDWLKWFTIFVTCGYMILYSKARTEQPLLVLIWGTFVFSLFSKKVIHSHNTKKLVLICASFALIILSVFFVAVQVIPLEYIQVNVIEKNTDFLEKIFHGRHIIWMDVLIYLRQTPFLTRLLGVDLGTEIYHTTTEMRLHSHYMKQFYSVGYMGCYLFTIFLGKAFWIQCDCERSKSKFIFFIAWLIFLVAGISTESMMFTQLSWIPMLFTGMIVSERTANGGQ